MFLNKSGIFITNNVLFFIYGEGMPFAWFFYRYVYLGHLPDLWSSSVEANSVH